MGKFVSITNSISSLTIFYSPSLSHSLCPTVLEEIFNLNKLTNFDGSEYSHCLSEPNTKILSYRRGKSSEEDLNRFRSTSPSLYRRIIFKHKHVHLIVGQVSEDVNGHSRTNFTFKPVTLRMPHISLLRKEANQQTHLMST